MPLEAFLCPVFFCVYFVLCW